MVVLFVLEHEAENGYVHELILRGEMQLPDFAEIHRFFTKKLAEAKSLANELEDPKKHLIIGMAYQHLVKVIDAKNHWKRVLPLGREKREEVRAKLAKRANEIRESLRQLDEIE